MCSQSVCERATLQQRLASRSASLGSNVSIGELSQLAVCSLVKLFDDRQKLFSRRLVVTGDVLWREETSQRQTIIALLGLNCLAQSKESLPFDLVPIQQTVLKDMSWIRSLGDLGLVTWFAAECAPERLKLLFKEFDFEKAFEMYANGCHVHTKDLAWFLAGLAHVRLANSSLVPDLTDVAADAYRLLQHNQGASGIFAHSASSPFLQRTFWRRFGSFADQIHSIYALTVFGRAFHIEEPLAAALVCANSLRMLQGRLGEWWSLFDSRRGCVANQYPVSTAHQAGTAPLALLTLGRVTGQDFDEEICKGISWLGGANELGKDLCDRSKGFVWNAIEPKRRAANYYELTMRFLRFSRSAHASGLRVRHEVRPDHFGWFLYAFTGISAEKALANA